MVVYAESFNAAILLSKNLTDISVIQELVTHVAA